MSRARLAVVALLVVAIGAGAACGTDTGTGADADDGSDGHGPSRRHTVTATLRDVSAAGNVLATVVDAGANNVQGVWFAREDSQAAIAEARELAVADARASAEELAGLTDSKFGRVVTMTESGVGSTSARDAGDMAEGSSSVPVSPGQTVVQVSVPIAWELAE